MRDTNVGFRVLDEFVCQAVPAPALSELRSSNLPIGTSRGVSSVQEAVVAAEVPDNAETIEENNEDVSRLLISAIFQARARELGKRLPALPEDLGFGEEGADAVVRVVSRYLMVRNLNCASPSAFRRAFFIDLAILMVDLARPSSVFCAEARTTTIEVAERLLQFEGWSPAPGTLQNWKDAALAVDPTAPRAAKAYHGLLKRYWGWTGKTAATSAEIAPITDAIVIPETILATLAKRCA